MGLYRKHRIIVALAFLVLGILTQKYFDLTRFQALLILFISATSLLIKKDFVFIVFFPVAILLSLNADNDPLIPKEILDKKITVNGTLHENPEKRQSSWRYIVDVKSIENGTWVKEAELRIALYSKENVKNIYRGTDVRIYNISLEQPGEFKNPGSFSLKSYFETKGIHYTAFVNNPLNIQPYGRNPNSNHFGFMLGKFRRNYSNFVREKLPEPQDEIINAITVGVKGAVPEKIRNDFSKLGISHLLAISGLHIGALAVFIYFIIKWTLKRSEYVLLKYEVPKIASILTIIPLFIYSAVAGFANPVQRAFIMISSYFIAFFFNREEEKLNILAAAAIIILLFSPDSLYELSFQLSFTAVSGILIFHKVYPFRFGNFTQKLYSMLKTTVAASLFTLPLVVNNFGYLPVATIPSNLIAVPLSGMLIVPLGLLSIISFPVSGTVCEYLLLANSKVIEFLLYLSNHMLGFKYSEITVPNIGITGYLFLLFTLVFIAVNRYSNKFKYLAVLSFFAFTFSLLSMHQNSDLNTDIEINFLDAGNKSYNLVTLSDGKTFLITGGYSYYSENDFAEKAGVIPYLLGKGITELDYLLMLSNDKSHLNGAEEILKRIRINNIWTNGSKLNSQLWEAIRNRGVRWKNAREEIEPVYSGDTSIRFIKPYVKENLWNSRQPRALLMIIKNSSRKILIGEGIHKTHVQKELTDVYSEMINADVIFMRKITGIDATFKKFLKTVSPQYLILNKPYKLGKFNVDNRFVTTEDGMVSLYLDDNNLRVNSYN